MRFKSTLCLLAVLCSATTPILAQDCIVYEDCLRWAGALEFPGNSYDVAIHGSHAYVANWLHGLRIVDISDPEFPADLGVVPTPSGYADGIVVTGSLCYVADGWGGLAVYDLADPASPTLLGSETIGGYADAVSVSGTLAVVAANGIGLRVMDVSDPSDPERRGLLLTSETVWGLDTQGSIAYAASSWSGNSSLLLVDFSDPDDPLLLSELPTPGAAMSVVVQGSIAYVADGSTGLLAVDVSNPLAPAILGSVETAAAADDLALAGPLAIVMISDGAQAVDISNPESMQALGYVRTDGNSRGIALSGSHAFIADDASFLSVVDFAQLGQVPVLGEWNSDLYLLNIIVEGDLASVLRFRSHPEYEYHVLYLLDISDPDSPSTIGFYEAHGFPRDHAVSGDYVYLATEYRLLAIDISDPGAPAHVGSYGGPGTIWPRDVEVLFPYAYLADHLNGFTVLDVSDPTDMTLVGEIVLPEGAHRLAVSEGYAFVADYEGDLLVVDVGDPMDPQVTGSVPLLSTYSLDVTVVGDLLFVMDWSTILQIFDISVPAAPSLLSTRLLRPGGADDIADWGEVRVAGTHAYVADGVGMTVLDIADPADPRIAGSVDPARYSQGLALSDTRAFLLSDEDLYVLPLHCDDVTAVAEGAPAATLRLGAHPNPFNPHSTVNFRLDVAESVRLAVYDLSGRRVRDLIEGSTYGPGRHELSWDGRDDRGRALPSGVYLYRLEAGLREETLKAVLLK